jgi:hypothetical protein
MNYKARLYMIFFKHICTWQMQFTPLKDDKVQIYLLFYKPASDDPFQNRLVAFFDGPFCHVEMAFPEKYGIEPWEKDMWGSSINQGDVIFFKTKTYQREGYFSFAIEVTKAQCLKIKNYCQMQSEKGVPFSKLAMYSAYLPIQLFNVEGTFCSKYVAMALQEGGVQEILRLNPCLVTPSSLYKTLLVNSIKSPIVQVVPSKMMPSTMSESSSASYSSSSSKHMIMNKVLCTNMANELIFTLREKRSSVARESHSSNNNETATETVIEIGAVPPTKFQQKMSEMFLRNCLMNEGCDKSKLVFF